jgi:hypothetical protein
MDVDTAFPNADLDENVFMYIPDGMNKTKGKCIKLVKALYGLKQSPRQWNILIHNFILSLNFIQLSTDACIYYYSDNNIILYIALYVDDILICGSNLTSIINIKEQIKLRFKCKDLGECTSFLGSKIIRDRFNLTTIINNEHLINKLLNKFDCNGTKKSFIPIDPHSHYTRPIDPNDILTDIPYRELVGTLLYIMMSCRPDICFTCNILSRYLDCPTNELWKLAIKTVYYLRSTKTIGIKFGDIDHINTNRLIVFSDSDWSGDFDSGRSTTGFIILCNGGPISWSSKLQPTAALSTTEAEYIALSYTLSEVLWLKQLMYDMKLVISHPILIYEDNKGAVDLANNPGYHSRTRHINVRYHFIRDHIKNSNIKVVAIPTKRQLAIMFTKGVSRPEFTFQRDQILGYVKLSNSYYINPTTKHIKYEEEKV